MEFSMRLAFYGRYSSDNQRDTSIEDQRRVVQRWAQRLGHDIVADYFDAAVSGASVRLLNGLQEALKAACTRPAIFDALAVDQLSRLSRDVGDTDVLIKRLRFFGIRVIAVSDSIDTADDTAKISVTVKSLVNELYLDDLRKTTKRGLDGQFLKGFSTGGRTFGYRSAPVYDATGRTDPRGNPIPVGYRLTVSPEEAEIVRQIFQSFRNGDGEKAIAKRLNAQRTGRTWRPNTIYLMLHNPKYVGRIHFNRREWRKNPDTGRRVYRWRSPDHWECTTVEALRIIDEDTWDAVQKRLRTRRHLFSHRRSATGHLLSGLLVCDACGGRLSIVAKDYYGCRNHVESNTCTNDLRIRRQAIEELVIGAIARTLPEWIEHLRSVATDRMRAGTENPTAEDHRRLLQLRRQAERIMTTIRQGRLQARALEEALSAYQALWDEVSSLEREQLSASRSRACSEIRYDRTVLDDFLAHLPDGLRSNIRSGREFLHETLKQVRVAGEDKRPRHCPVCSKQLGKLTPQHLAQHGLTLQEGYRKFPELGFNKRARLVIQPSPDGLLQTGEVFGFVVAGAGFEPATFGL
jgi:site-specific DNA recombinase